MLLVGSPSDYECEGVTSVTVELMLFLLALLVFAGVVLPAVWSRHGYRRTAARRPLVLLLRAVRGRFTP